MAFFEEFTGGKFLSGGQITLTIGPGMNRTLVHLKKIIANLPGMTEESTIEMAALTRDQARRNVIFRSRYKDRDAKLQRHPIGTLASGIIIGDVVIGDGETKVVVKIHEQSPAIRYAAAVEHGRAGGRLIRAKTTRKGYLKFRWSGGPLGSTGASSTDIVSGEVMDSEYHFYRSIIQGSTMPMNYMRDAALDSAEIMRMKFDMEVGNLVKNK